MKFAIAFLCLFLFVGCCAESKSEPKPPVNVESVTDDSQVAGRYHLRKRSRRFFGRVA